MRFDRRPLVTIVTPSLNQGRFLEATLRTIHCSVPIPIEHIVVDGGSTDGSLAVLRDWNPPPHVTFSWISEPDRGQAHAVNKGVELACAEVIGWVNSDDCLLPGTLPAVIDHFSRRPSDVLVYGEADWIDDLGRTIQPYPTRHAEGSLAAPVAEFQDGCFICQPAAFFRGSAFRSLGGLKEELQTAMDLDLWLRFYSEFPDCIGFSSAKLAGSRLHPDIKTRRVRETVFRESITVLHEHLGAVSAHWVQSFVAEVAKGLVFSGTKPGWRRQLREFLCWAIPLVDMSERTELINYLRQDRRLQLAGDDILVDLYPDGWTSTECGIVLGAVLGSGGVVSIYGRHQAPHEIQMSLCIEAPGKVVQEALVLKERGPFRLNVSVAACDRPSRLVLRCNPGFVPADVVGGDDHRRLGVQIDRVDFVSAEGR